MKYEPIEYYKGIFDQFKEDLDPEHWCCTLPDIMWGLGFEMDCYNSYYEIYPELWEYHLTQKEEDDIILNNLAASSIQIAGNYIFSRFRYLTHWSYGYNTADEAYFFSKAFAILEEKFEKTGK